MSFKNKPAIFSRLKLLLSIIIDYFIINIFFYVYIPSNKLFVIGIRQYFYILFWVLLSYIFDRYQHHLSNVNNFNFLSLFLNTLKSIILFGVIFLLYNWFLGNYISRSFLLTFLANLFFYSTIIQYLINKLLFRKLHYFQYWVFIGIGNFDKSNFKNNFFNLDTIKVFNLEKISNNNKLIEEAEGIVLRDFQDLDKSDLDFLLNLKKQGKAIYKLSTWLKIFLKRYPPYLIDSKDLLDVKFPLLNNSLLMRLKRIGDIFISFLLLLFCSPLILISAILIYFEDRGPIFYRQKRSGYLGGIFTIWKLRSMMVNAEEKGIRWSSKDDERITNVGSILRKTRIDELPQLWSVFVGDMSLIGPRPERPEFDNYLIDQIPFYSMRYLLRPGLSGWAQVNYPYGASTEDTINKLSYDIFYIANYSFWLDLSIFFKTLRLIFNAKGSKPNITF